MFTLPKTTMAITVDEFENKIYDQEKDKGLH